MTKFHEKTSESSFGKIAVLGLPFDRNSSFRRGPALAPPRVREAFFSESTTLWTEKEVDLETTPGWMFPEDLVLSDAKTAFAEIESAMDELLANKTRVIALGGDHSVTYPIMRSYGKVYDKLNILQLDAHPDLYDELDGNRYSHACPFARIMEENPAASLTQVGVRTMTGHQRAQAEKFGVEVIGMNDQAKIDELEFQGPLYLSLDMDCLDPAFAPGVSHLEPGGMTTRDVLRIIRNLKGDLIGADIVEFNPERDPMGITGMVAGKLLKEIIGAMLEKT